MHTSNETKLQIEKASALRCINKPHESIKCIDTALLQDKDPKCLLELYMNKAETWSFFLFEKDKLNECIQRLFTKTKTIFLRKNKNV